MKTITLALTRAAMVRTRFTVIARLRRLDALCQILTLLAAVGASTSAVAQDSQPVARVIIMGDSISAGDGAQWPQWSYASLLQHNDSAAYPQDAGRDLETLWGPGVKFIFIAHAGDTSHAVMRNQLPRLLGDATRDAAALGPFPVKGHTVVVMTVGGNDVRLHLGSRGDPHGAALRYTLHNITVVLSAFADRHRFPDGVTVYLGNVYDITDGTNSAYRCLLGLRFTGLAEALRTWRQAYTDLAATTTTHTLRVVPVDLLSSFYGHGFHFSDPINPYYRTQDPTLWLSDDDCIHPNSRGHHELRRLFYQAIVETF